MIRLNAAVHRFRSNSSGSVLIPFGLAVTLIAGSVGGAIDFNRWHYAKRVTSDAMDAAVLAGARTLQLNPTNTQAALNVATAYFQQNVSGKVDLAVNTVAFSMADNNQAITATGNAKINASFLRLIGIDRMTVFNDPGTKAKVTVGGAGGSNIEIAVMLDVTGSMCDSGIGPCTTGAKLTGLKNASKHLVDLVIPDTQGSYYAKMSLVPFAMRVRLGPDGGGGSIMQRVTNLPPTQTLYERVCTDWVFTPDGGTAPSTPPSEWGGGGGGGPTGTWSCNNYQVVERTNWKLAPCVTDRFYDSTWDFDYTDVEPRNNRWMNAQDGSRRLFGNDSSNTPLASGTGTSSDPTDGQWNYNSTGVCYDVDNANQIMPLTTNKTALKARIDGLVANGPTAGVLGTAWTWYTLSPEWNSVWSGDQRPGRYEDLTELQPNNRPVLRKVAILMTDGIFNTYRSWAGADEVVMANAAKQMCTNMKATGIEIFTVGLGLNELTTTQRARAEDILQSCGTDISHFYSTINAAELQAAFQNIGYQLAGVSLTR